MVLWALLCVVVACVDDVSRSIVVNTWPFTDATNAGWLQMMSTKSPLDAVEHGCHKCEIDQCDGSVGYGGSPNDHGETTLDAMVMCGRTRSVGSVANLKQVKAAIKVARKVMEETYHTLLVGEDATDFAVKVGFAREDLSTNSSRSQYEKWVSNGRVPNYWRKKNYEAVGHDTIGMVAMNDNLDVACGTSTNGLTFRIAGRVGDSPIVGSGAYCENNVGGCAATGNGDVIMRFLPAYHAVLLMRYQQIHPREASRIALEEITKFYDAKTEAFAGLVCMDTQGRVGAHAIGQFRDYFKYSVRNSTMTEAQVFSWEQ